MSKSIQVNGNLDANLHDDLAPLIAKLSNYQKIVTFVSTEQNERIIQSNLQSLNTYLLQNPCHEDLVKICMLLAAPAYYDPQCKFFNQMTKMKGIQRFNFPIETQNQIKVINENYKKFIESERLVSQGMMYLNNPSLCDTKEGARFLKTTCTKNPKAYVFFTLQYENGKRDYYYLKKELIKYAEEAFANKNPKLAAKLYEEEIAFKGITNTIAQLRYPLMLFYDGQLTQANDQYIKYLSNTENPDPEICNHALHAQMLISLPGLITHSLPRLLRAKNEQALALYCTLLFLGKLTPSVDAVKEQLKLFPSENIYVEACIAWIHLQQNPEDVAKDFSPILSKDTDSALKFPILISLGKGDPKYTLKIVVALSEIMQFFNNTPSTSSINPASFQLMLCYLEVLKIYTLHLINTKNYADAHQILAITSHAISTYIAPREILTMLDKSSDGINTIHTFKHDHLILSLQLKLLETSSALDKSKIELNEGQTESIKRLAIRQYPMASFLLGKLYHEGFLLPESRAEIYFKHALNSSSADEKAYGSLYLAEIALKEKDIDKAKWYLAQCALLPLLQEEEKHQKLQAQLNNTPTSAIVVDKPAPPVNQEDFFNVSQFRTDIFTAATLVEPPSPIVTPPPAAPHFYTQLNAVANQAIWEELTNPLKNINIRITDILTMLRDHHIIATGITFSNTTQGYKIMHTSGEIVSTHRPHGSHANTLPPAFKTKIIALINKHVFNKG